eukprot:15224466-Heterocapsa_arctica.AAC.1
MSRRRGRIANNGGSLDFLMRNMLRRAAEDLIRIELFELGFVRTLSLTLNGKVNASPLVLHGEANGLTTIG